MKKTIIALFLVLLTLGLCVSCDASVDKKLLGGNGSTVKITIAPCFNGVKLVIPIFYSIDAPVGKTWEEFINTSSPTNLAIDSGSGAVMLKEGSSSQGIYKDTALSPAQALKKNEIIGATTEYYTLGNP